MDALMVRSPYVEQILSGDKAWEIRGTRTQKRGPIALIRSGSGFVVGYCKIIDVVGPLSLAQYNDNARFHQDDGGRGEADSLPYPKTYAWVLASPKTLQNPLPYDHPSGAIKWVKLPGLSQESAYPEDWFRCPSDRLRSSFLEALAADLRLLNHTTSYTKQDEHHQLHFEAHDTHLLSNADRQAYYRSLYQTVKERLWGRNADFIRAQEDALMESGLFPRSDVLPDGVCPVVEVCGNKHMREIYKYCRVYQGLSANDGVGRRFSALVFDVGQERRALIGAIGLADTGYALRDRDRLLGWDDTSRPLDQLRALRHKGLRRMMQLAVCIALPPYNLLYGGKLLALLALSDPIRAFYRRRYGEPLMALITTAAFGTHAAIFNRLNARQFRSSSLLEEERPLAREIYRHIGDTEGYSSAFISEETLRLASDLVHASSHRGRGQRGLHSDSSVDSIVRRALTLCGVSHRVLKVNEKGIYFGCVDDRYQQALVEGSTPSSECALPVDVLVDYWRRRWLGKLSGAREQEQVLRGFDPSAALLVRHLDRLETGGIRQVAGGL